MKTTFKNLLLAAAGLLIFTGCAKDDTTQELPTQRYELSFSGAKPELQSDTRTVFDNGSVLWSPSGERIRMAFTVDGAWVNNNSAGNAPALYQSNDAAVSTDGKTATFTIAGNFSDPGGGAYQFYALYPGAVTSSTTLPDAPAIEVNVPATQSPSATSFDAKADVMLAKSGSVYTALPTTEPIPLVYKRMVAHGAVTLTGLPFETDETIKSITFTAPAGTALAGTTTYDIVEQTQTNSSPAVNAITLNYADATLAAGAFTGWFCSVPFTVASGDPFTIEVTSSRGTYTHTIYARVAGIVFRQNTYNTLSVNMATATFEATEDLGIEGDYVVLALQSGTYYAMSSVDDAAPSASADRRDPRVFDYDGTATAVATDDETLVWTIAAAGNGNYTLANGGQYLYWPGTPGATSNNIARMQATAYPVTITQIEDEPTYYIQSAADQTRHLSKNSSADLGFAFYGNTNQTEELYLVPATVVALPKVTVDQTTLGLTADDIAINSIGVTLKNATETDLTVADYEGTESMTDAEWLTAVYNNGNVDITAGVNSGEARTARVVLTVATALGTNSATITVSQGAAGGSEEVWVEVTDFSTITTGQYIYVAIKGGVNYYMSNATATSAGDVKPVVTTLLPDAIGFTSAANMVVTFTGSQTNGFSISNGANYLGATNTNNGVTMQSSNSTTLWKITTHSTCGFTIEQTTPNTNRFLGMYLTQDYRTYNSAHANITTNTTYKLYRLTSE